MSPGGAWLVNRGTVGGGCTGCHDDPFGMRLSRWMIAKKLPDASVPMSLLADHPSVQLNFHRKGIGVVTAEMH